MSTGGGDVLRSETVKLFDNDIVFYEELTVFLIWTATVEGPAWSYGVLVEGTEDWLFDFVRDRHVIFDSVQTSQHEIKYANLYEFPKECD